MKINLPVTGRNVDFAPDANILSTTDLTSAMTYAKAWAWWNTRCLGNYWRCWWAVRSGLWVCK